MSDWYAEQLARAKQRRYGAGRRFKRGRRFVAGDVVKPTMPTRQRQIEYGATRAMQQRDAARRLAALDAARRLRG